MKRRSIVFVNQATGYLTIDIIHAFLRSGHFDRVGLLAGSVREQDVKLDSQVEWTRIVRYSRGGPASKALSWLAGTLQVAWHLFIRYRNYEVVYVTVPPFAYLLSLLRKGSFSVLVFDVYPDALQSAGVSPGNLIYRAWAYANRVLFSRAYRIYTLGERMRVALSRYCEPDRIEVIPNWAGLSTIEFVPKSRNSFLDSQGLLDKFIILYSGNVGYTHPVEVILDVAKRVQNDERLFFLIVGRGDRFKSLQSEIDRLGLMNCRLLPFQPDDQLSQTLSAADLAVVVLDDKTREASVPSKIYNLQSVGAPILAIASNESDVYAHLEKFENGICFQSGDSEKIAKFVRDFQYDIELQRRWRAKSFEASKQFTSKNAEKYIVSYVSEVAKAMA